MCEGKSLSGLEILKGIIVFVIGCFLSLVDLKFSITMAMSIVKNPSMIFSLTSVLTLIITVIGISIVYSMFKYSFGIYVRFLHRNM